MDNFETSLATTVDKARGNSSGAIVDRFIKHRTSTIFGHPLYSMDGSGPSMAVSGQHEEFFNSSFGIWIGGKYFSDGCCRPIRMQKLWRALVLRQHRVKQLSIMRHKVDMRRSRVVPGKHGMVFLMIALKEAKIKAEAIPVHMHQDKTETQQFKDKE